VTSFHHQPEAQHPKSSAIHKLHGRLPHLWVIRDRVGLAASPAMSHAAEQVAYLYRARNLI
jgi:hypothetical protein